MLIIFIHFLKNEQVIGCSAGHNFLASKMAQLFKWQWWKMAAVQRPAEMLGGQWSCFLRLRGETRARASKRGGRAVERRCSLPLSRLPSPAGGHLSLVPAETPGRRPKKSSLTRYLTTSVCAVETKAIARERTPHSHRLFQLRNPSPFVLFYSHLGNDTRTAAVRPSLRFCACSDLI